MNLIAATRDLIVRRPHPAGVALAAGRGVERRTEISIGDPALAAYLGIGGSTAAGETVSVRTALGLTAVYRAVALIAGTIASLPLKSYRTDSDGERVRVSSVLDNPGGEDGPTPFEWVETLVAHLLLWGNAYAYGIENDAGGLVALQLLDPPAVGVRRDYNAPGHKVFSVAVRGDGNVREFTADEVLHIPALTTDGVLGMSPIAACRNAIGTGLASDKAAGRMFRNGLMMAGLVSTDDDVTEEEGETIATNLRTKAADTRAGDIAFVNRRLKFDRWGMSAEDAQFIEARAFQVEEVARLFGLPKVLLAEDGASTWGSGISELIRGMQRFTLAAWTSRIERRLSTLLQGSRFCEFDYSGLLEGSPAEVTTNLAAEIDAGLLTVNEARRIKNRPPIAGGDELRPRASAPAPNPPQEVTE